MIYALDTNIIIDSVNNVFLVSARLEDALKNNLPMVIPTVVDYEVMRGFRYVPSKHKEAHYTAIRNLIPLAEVDSAVWTQAAIIWANLRKVGKGIGDADTIISAQCLVNSYTLITHNTSDFERVEGLKLMDW